MLLHAFVVDNTNPLPNDHPLEETTHPPKKHKKKMKEKENRRNLVSHLKNPSAGLSSRFPPLCSDVIHSRHSTARDFHAR